MSRIWPLRSLPNFALTVIGLSGVGFYAYGAWYEQYFANPVVAEAVKILGKNEKVKQMIGYPMSYQASTKNKFNQQGNQLYFDFKVIGPRGSTEVEVTATQLKAKQVYEYDSQIEPIKAAQVKYKSLEKQVQELKSKLPKTQQKSSGWFGNKKPSQAPQQPQQLSAKTKQLQQTKTYIDQIKNERKMRKNQYCIPEKQFYAQIVGQTGKDNTAVLPQQATLYKLQNIACQLPNKSRINVLNSGQAFKAQDYETKLDQKVNFGDLTKPIYGPLHEKLSINVAELSDEEIEQYSKHKTNFMYQRYNQYRILTFMCFMIGSGALFVYFAKNKTKNMSNSVLYQLTSTKIARNPKMDQFLRKNKLRQLDLDKNVGGGMKNNVFNCQIGVNNVTMGRVQIQGKHFPKTGGYDYSKFVFRYVEDNQHKEIDLLK